MRHLLAGVLYAFAFVILMAHGIIYVLHEHSWVTFLADWWWSIVLLGIITMSAIYLGSDYARPRLKPRRKLHFKWPSDYN